MTEEHMARYDAERILGLSSDYTQEDLKTAYRAAVMKNHPDLGGNAERMVQINIAKSLIDSMFSEDSNRVMHPVDASEAYGDEYWAPVYSDSTEEPSQPASSPASESTSQDPASDSGEAAAAPSSSSDDPTHQDSSSSSTSHRASRYPWYCKAAGWLNCLDSEQLKRAFWPGFIVEIILYFLAEFGFLDFEAPDYVIWPLLVLCLPFLIIFQPLLAIVNIFVPVLYPVRFLIVELLSFIEYACDRIQRNRDT